MAKDLDFYKAAFEIGEAQSWADWHSDSGYTSDELFINGLGSVLVVDRKGDDRDDGFGGEYRQGSTDELSVTFAVELTGGETRYFRKYGESDSYGDESWSGRFVEVVPDDKIVVIYKEV